MNYCYLGSCSNPTIMSLSNYRQQALLEGGLQGVVVKVQISLPVVILTNFQGNVAIGEIGLRECKFGKEYDSPNLWKELPPFKPFSRSPKNYSYQIYESDNFKKSSSSAMIHHFTSYVSLICTAKSLHCLQFSRTFFRSALRGNTVSSTNPWSDFLVKLMLLIQRTWWPTLNERRTSPRSLRGLLDIVSFNANFEKSYF